MIRMLRQVLCILVASALLSPQLAVSQSVPQHTRKLCVLVDGSLKMVIEKSYDAVNEVLSTKLMDMQQKKTEAFAWQVDIIAIGVSSRTSAKGGFVDLSLFPNGPGLDSDKQNNRIPGAKEESVVVHASSKNAFHQYLAEQVNRYDGVVVISDHPLVKLLTGTPDKYFKPVLVETQKDSITAVPKANSIKIGTDVKDALDGFMASIKPPPPPVKEPKVSVACQSGRPFFVGSTLQFKVTGSDLDHIEVDYGDDTPVVTVKAPQIDRVLEHTYSAVGSFTVLVRGSSGTREAAAKLSVAIEPPPTPLAPTVELVVPKITPLYSGIPVQIGVSVKNAVEAVIDFGDGIRVAYDKTMAVEGTQHLYAAPGSYKLEVTARGNGLETKKADAVIVLTPPPPVGMGVEVNQESRTVTVTPNAQLATSIQINFGDGSQPVDTANGKVISHKYAEDGEYLLQMTAQRQGKVELAREKVTVKAPPPLMATLTIDETRNLDVTMTPRALKATSIVLDFGDGTAPVEAQNAQAVTHTYPAANEYLVRMTVHRTGKTETVDVPVLIDPVAPPPKAAFAPENQEPSVDGSYSVRVKDAVHFINNSKNARRYQWTFGDDSEPVTDRSPSHVFNKTGGYTVTLTAYGATGTRSTATAIINVQGGGVPPIFWLLLVGAVVTAAWGCILWMRRPQLTVTVTVDGQEGNSKSFALFDHRLALSDLSTPIECRARKVDDLWQVEFRSMEDRVLERLPSQAPIRLEARMWSVPINPGEFVVAGKPNEVIKIQGEQ